MLRDAETESRLFRNALERTIGIEKGFSNHKNDSGGKTRWGITEKVARAHGYGGDMRELPLSFAEQIYRVDYWNRLACDRICLLSGPISHELFDSGVNCGVDAAGAWLQRALNVFNRQQADYQDIKVDGRPGTITITALGKFLRIRGGQGELVMMRALNSLQGAYYVQITEGRPTQEDFCFGWFANRVVI